MNGKILIYNHIKKTLLYGVIVYLKWLVVKFFNHPIVRFDPYQFPTSNLTYWDEQNNKLFRRNLKQIFLDENIFYITIIYCGNEYKVQYNLGYLSLIYRFNRISSVSMHPLKM